MDYGQYSILSHYYYNTLSLTMSLESNIRPDSPGSDERMQVEDDPTDTERAPYSATIFKDTIQRYHQRTLSGSIANVLNVFDDADTLFWPSLAGHPGVEVSSVSREFSNRCLAVDLPAEILCEIFIYLLPEEGWQGMCPPQLVVTQVCSYSVLAKRRDCISETMVNNQYRQAHAAPYSDDKIMVRTRSKMSIESLYRSRLS
ncbi:hypothetical protein EV361DRAFT_932231 [Lentinula raphanica]|nr:hypothetical protein EV361DRAFT_932231 [Lentinula raphanica]